MKITTIIEVWDDTPAEALPAGTVDQVRQLYHDAFTRIMAGAVHPNAKYSVTTNVRDNTKEAKG